MEAIIHNYVRVFAIAVVCICLNTLSNGANTSADATKEIIAAGIAYQNGQWDQVIEKYTALRENKLIEGNYLIWSYIKIARAYARLGKPDEGLEELQLLIDTHKNNDSIVLEGQKFKTVALARSHQERAMIFRKTGKYIDAIDSYATARKYWLELIDESNAFSTDQKRAHALEDDAGFDLNIAECWLAAGKPVKAKKMFLDLRPKYDLLLKEDDLTTTTIFRVKYYRDVYLPKKLGDLTKDKSFYMKASQAYPQASEKQIKDATSLDRYVAKQDIEQLSK